MSEELGDLEKKFMEVYNERSKEINKCLDKASQALAEAEALSEKYGIPFYSGVSRVSQNYEPHSLETLFPDLDKSAVAEAGDYDIAFTEYGGGWEHSGIC